MRDGRAAATATGDERVGRGTQAHADRGFRFQPGIEGLRGVAVVAVLLYHGGFSWMRGGFLGVSLFFTLSGFLITSLLVRERERAGWIDARAFWGRRLRRLLPASLVCLAGTVLFSATVATPAQLATYRGDALAALGYVANWRFIATDVAYGDLFAAPSPVLHFWSLAIEEQFYLVFPVVVALLLKRRGVRSFTAALGAGVALSLAVSVRLSIGHTDAAYYSTFSRVGEVLVGALLAVLLHRPPVGAALRTPGGRTALRVAGTVAAAGLVWSWSHVSQTDVTLYRGGLLLHAVLSAVVITAALDDGPLARLLSVRSLLFLGRISYGLYLYHWPIFLWLTPARTGLSGMALFAVRMAVTLVAALLSHRFVEQPIRERTDWSGGRVLLAPLGICLVAVLVVVVPPRPDAGDLVSFAAAEQPVLPDLPPVGPTTTTPVGTTVATEGTGGPAVVPAVPPGPVRADGEPWRVYLTGDSGIFTLASGLMTWGEETGAATFWNGGRFGCGIGRGGALRFQGQARATGEACDNYDWWTPIDQIRPHVVVLMSGTWDVVDRQLPGRDDWLAFGDPEYDAFIERELLASIDLLQRDGARLVLLTHPTIDPGLAAGAPGRYAESDPERMRRYNEILLRAASQRSRISVLDLAGYMRSRDNGELDLAERPDGIHWTPRSARSLAEWLGPQLVDLAQEGAAATSPYVLLARD